MATPRTRPGSHRMHRVWTSVLLVLVGALALGGLGIWLQRARETDLQSAAGSVTTKALLDIPDDAPAIRFTDVAADLGLTMRHGPGARTHALPEDTGSGLAWGDYDGDGDLDLYALNFATLPDGSAETEPVENAGAEPLDSVDRAEPLDGANRLFRNDGGRFVDMAAQAGVADPEGFGMGAGFADYDADGDLDLYVTNFGPNRLYRNRGDGTFEDVAAEAGVADPLWSTGAAWGDYDRDGHLDLYVANYVQWDPGTLGAASDLHTEFPFTLNPNSFSAEPNRLYRNRGDGTFEELAVEAGVDDPDGRGLNAAFCDLDGDGWLDIFVNNDTSPNRFFRNLGADGTGQLGFGHLGFEDRSAATGVADPRSGMGLSIADLAGAGGPNGGPDGWPDLFIANWVAQDNALYRAVVEAGQLAEFHDDARSHGLAEISTAMVGWGTVAADLDRDGRADLVVVNGSTLQPPEDPLLLQPQESFVFWNGGERFYNVAPAAGEALVAPHNGRGLAAADYDGDGDVDLAVSINRGAPLLLRNDTVSNNHGLAVTLDAPDALRFGARIRVTVGDAVQTRWFGGDTSYLSMHAPDLPFGLGTATTADRVEVTWADGRTTEREAVPSGRVRVAR